MVDAVSESVQAEATDMANASFVLDRKADRLFEDRLDAC